MTAFSRPVTDIIRERFSCRTYVEEPIETLKQEQLRNYVASLEIGPLGTPAHFHLVAATQEDRNSLKELGTYGFIQGATGFIVGAVDPGEKDLEDYGYLMEKIILFATDLGLGTCWLGGTFTRGAFASKISLEHEEQIPAVTSIGYIADPENARKGMIRRHVGADQRLPWEQLFFLKRFGAPLTREEAANYAESLEMVRLGPSASNKQPWRIVKDGSAWHFYLQRTKGYREGIIQKYLKVADIQRLDMGIAMCHFELTAGELGSSGKWVVQEPGIGMPDDLTEYTVSWVS